MTAPAGSIVCGVDGSRDSRVALHVAAGLADRLGLRLVVAYVTPLRQVFSPAPLGGIMPVPVHAEGVVEVHLGERLLDQMMLEESRSDADRRVVVPGIPAERLADLADEEHAEAIVVGSRGRGALRAAFLGSVSHQLVGMARCPVLVVPRGAAREG